MNLMLLKAEILRNFSKTLFNILIVAIAVALFIVFKTMTYSYQISANEPFRRIGVNLIIHKNPDSSSFRRKTNMEGVQLPFSNVAFEKEEFVKLKGIHEIETISKSLLIWDMSKGKFKTIMGIDAKGPSIGANQIKNWIVKGRFPEKDSEIALEKHFAKFHGLKEGDSLIIGSNPLKIVGQVEIKEGSQLAAANSYVLIQTAQRLVNLPDAVNIVYVTLNDMGKLEKVKKDISRIIPQVKISSSNSFLESASSMAIIADKFSSIISLIAAIAASLLIIKVMFTSFAERVRDIGILKAVGWSNGEIKKELILEAMVQNFLGSVIGIILGIIVCWCISFITIDVTLPGQTLPTSAAQYVLNFQETTLPFVLLPELFALAVVVSVLIGIVSGYLLANKSLEIRPAEVLRTI
jgi:putative ABC transport system permease protein